jgi:hypothetical protein
VSLSRKWVEAGLEALWAVVVVVVGLVLDVFLGTHQWAKPEVVVSTRIEIWNCFSRARKMCPINPRRSLKSPNLDR